LSIHENVILFVYLYFKDSTHLIGPNSCMCVGCYQAIEKRTFTKNHSKRACLIMSCEQTGCHIFNSKWLDKLKSTLLINKVCKLLNCQMITFNHIWIFFWTKYQQTKSNFNFKNKHNVWNTYVMKTFLIS